MQRTVLKRFESPDEFYVPPGQDSWVVRDEPYVSLHFMGADQYAHGATGR